MALPWQIPPQPTVLPLTLLAEPALPALIAAAAEAAYAVDARAVPAARAVALVVQGRSRALVTVCERQRDGAGGDVDTFVFLSNLQPTPGVRSINYPSIRVFRTHSPKYLIQKASCGGREGRVRVQPGYLGEAYKALPLLE